MFFPYTDHNHAIVMTTIVASPVTQVYANAAMLTATIIKIFIYLKLNYYSRIWLYFVKS